MASLTVYSKFPNTSPLPPEQSYESLIDQMHADYVAFSKHHEVLKMLDILTTDWEARRKDLEGKKFTRDSLIPIYEKDLKKYDEIDRTREAVKALFSSFQAKKEICFPNGNCPETHLPTLMIFKRLKIDLKPIQEEYDKILTSNFNDISREFVSIEKSVELMKKQLSKLNGLLETAATLCTPGRTVRLMSPTYLQMDLAALREREEKKN